jgi:hypothetical protein
MTANRKLGIRSLEHLHRRAAEAHRAAVGALPDRLPLASHQADALGAATSATSAPAAWAGTTELRGACPARTSRRTTPRSSLSGCRMSTGSVSARRPRRRCPLRGELRPTPNAWSRAISSSSTPDRNLEASGGPGSTGSPWPGPPDRRRRKALLSRRRIGASVSAGCQHLNRGL